MQIWDRWERVSHWYSVGIIYLTWQIYLIDLAIFFHLRHDVLQSSFICALLISLFVMLPDPSSIWLISVNKIDSSPSFFLISFFLFILSYELSHPSSHLYCSCMNNLVIVTSCSSFFHTFTILFFPPVSGLWFSISSIMFLSDTTTNSLKILHGNESKLQKTWQCFPLRPQRIFILGEGSNRTIFSHGLLYYFTLS